MEYINDEGEIINDTKKVLSHWQNEYQKLFSFDGHTAPPLSENNVHISEELPGLNHDIEFEEVKKVIIKAKNGKAMGIDNLPNEIFKNVNSMKLLLCFFKRIFQFEKTPTIWSVGIIKPIPKTSLVDPRVPLQYRGITLLSTLYKLFASVLNNRISQVCETHGLYADEQNGFRPGRACIDHIFVTTSIIRNRKNKKLPTFACFVDLEKAFDRIDRNILFNKLHNLGFRGKILNCLKNIYSDCKCTVNVNGMLTETFSSHYGVRQGDTLSPTLFNIFINDLISDIKNGSAGVKCGDNLVHCLLYADDLVMFSETENDLQTMLNILYSWCSKWCMKANIDKTKVIHFRGKNTPQTDFNFSLGNSMIDIVDTYKYLGILLHYTLNYEITADVLSKSAGRALSAICSKFRIIKGLGIQTYTKMFHSGVAPILDYCAGVWGKGNLSKLDTIQNRAQRFFLGVHRFAPNLAVNGDFGWMSCVLRRHVEIVRLWNRLVDMNENRLTFRIFIWDKENCKKNWSGEVKHLLIKCNCETNFNSMSKVNINYVRNIMFEIEKTKWNNDLNCISKLRTYCTFKNTFETEPYLSNVFDRHHRSALAALRSGILPLKVETGRYQNIPVNLRLCVLCESNDIESESHFLFVCSKYHSLRERFFNVVSGLSQNFFNVNESEKFKILMSANIVKYTAEFIWNCFNIRQKTLYNLM